MKNPSHTGHIAEAFERASASLDTPEDPHFPDRLRLAWRATRFWLLRTGDLDGPSAPLDSIDDEIWEKVLPPEGGPEEKGRIKRWIGEYTLMVNQLKLTRELRRGLWGYESSSGIHPRRLHPSRDELVAFERTLIAASARTLATTSTIELQDQLEQNIGLGPAEFAAFLRLVRAYIAKAYDPGDLEEQRSLMILRLEDVARRSRESLDLRAELMALKQISTALGLGLTAGESTEREFIDVVARVSKYERFEGRTHGDSGRFLPGAYPGRDERGRSAAG